MDIVSALAIFIGAGCGALLRWCMGILLNPLSPSLPLGTLGANVLGGLLMGIAMGVFGHFETLNPAVRLAVTTGFLGGLTTFSTYSAETTVLLLRTEYAWAVLHVVAHVGLSLAATVGGLALTTGLLRQLSGAIP